MIQRVTNELERTKYVISNKNNRTPNSNKKMCGAPNSTILRFNLNEENGRLQTFAKWTKSEINIHELARYGWYFPGKLDLVRCHFCGAEKTDWIIGDHPLTEHVQLSPSCPLLIRQSNNKPFNQEYLDEHLPPITSIETLSTGKDKIKLTGADAVLHPEFRSYSKRMETFKEWPKALRPTSHELSDAGFFYLGKSDQVRCFCCSGIIENWKSEWNAWEQHVHRFEDCQFVQLCKSKVFISEVHGKFSGQGISQSNQINVEESGPAKNTTSLSLRTCNACCREELNAIFIPCMHIVMCIECGSQRKLCPVCGKEINEVKKCYIL